MTNKMDQKSTLIRNSPIIDILTQNRNSSVPSVTLEDETPVPSSRLHQMQPNTQVQPQSNFVFQEGSDLKILKSPAFR